MAQTSESQLDTRDNLTIAKALIEQGRVQEAVLCLEAEVQQN